LNELFYESRRIRIFQSPFDFEKNHPTNRNTKTNGNPNEKRLENRISGPHPKFHNPTLHWTTEDIKGARADKTIRQLLLSELQENVFSMVNTLQILTTKTKVFEVTTMFF
jgi:hypothetical protein